MSRVKYNHVRNYICTYMYIHVLVLDLHICVGFTDVSCLYMYLVAILYVWYRSDARYKARVIYTRLLVEATNLYTEANTCLNGFIQGNKHVKEKARRLPYTCTCTLYLVRI